VDLPIGSHSTQEAQERPLVPERLRPLARTAFYALRAARAHSLARVRLRHEMKVSAPVFIIGCGRSGTTLLGKLFGMHPGVRYLQEPYDLWAAIDRATDALQLYSRGDYHCLLDADALTVSARRRFERLMSAPPDRVLVEKSPTNTLRIGYLDAIAPRARFVHIVRDGVDVARSIERGAAVTKRMAFRPPLNEWWGVGDVKWTALQRDGRAAGYYPEEVHELKSDAQRGAYEWLISLREVDAWRARLGGRLVELRYQDLTDDPSAKVRAVMDSIGLSCPEEWLESATAIVNSASTWHGIPLTLPDRMRADFNRLQASFGFKGRAGSETTSFSAPRASG
jgi:hypothetical protein